MDIERCTMTEPSKEHDIPPELLKEYLHKEQMTPAKLAAHLNVAETTVHRWLKGEAKPTGTAKAVLWTLIGLAGIAAGALAPAAAGLVGGASAAVRLLRGASIGVGAISSCIGLYKLLREKLESVGVDEVEEAVEVLKEKERQEQKVMALREQLAEEERKLREIEERTRKEDWRDRPDE
jgi:DNA-binding transcriptional regulator YiaG